MVQPLSLTGVGTRAVIKEIRQKHEIKHFMESLGFVSGAEVCVVCEAAGNLIVGIRDSRVAISRAMAHDIVVESNPTAADYCATCPAVRAKGGGE